MYLSNFNKHTGVQGILQYYAQHTPDQIALIFKEDHLSYLELDKRTDDLAWYLQEQGVQKGDFVAIYLKRSLDLLISILAIQKAGAAYVPIDFDYPAERMAFMIKDSKAKAILTHCTYQAQLPQIDACIICLDQDWSRIESEAKNKQYQDSTLRTDLAYMIYTSGSTGKPKGVMITHENIFNQLEGQQQIAPARMEKMLLTCSISFDVSVLSIYWTFYQGATLVIPEQGEEKDIQRLSATIENHKISHILTLPSLHTMILGQANPNKLKSLQLINVSGEVCPTSLAQKHEALLPNCQLYNLYGPTEATVNCTFFKFPKGYSEPKVPIGIPIENYEMFILNDNLEEQGVGAVGEIYIGGSKPVVGKGYWNRVELSAERFIQNPFKADRGGAVLYKTGDLGKWMPDGNIEFLGRSDFQVKYRGFRVELGEIEVAINRYLPVKEVVVLLKNKELIGQQKLVAYLTLNKPEAALNVSEIRQFLADSLPEYMLPTNFVVLEKMPLTPNGKFDRKALPDPPKERPHLAQSFEAPTGVLEKKIATIWEQLLAIDGIGRQDKFFELGGNSIQAAQFIGQLQKEMGTSIFVTTIFDYPTIATYAAMLEDKYAAEIPHFCGTANSDFQNPFRNGIGSIAQSIDKKDGQERQENSLETNSSTASNSTIPESLTEWKLNSFSHFLPRLSQFDKTPDKNPPAIFILAPPRSGTSLLRLMLAGHPDLLAVNELKLLGFHDLAERNRTYTGKYSLWQEGVLRLVMELKKCDAEQARLLVQDYVNKGYSTKQFYRQLQEWARPKIIVDKTPSYALDPAVLQKAEQDFENAIFLHLVRHPYAMIQSFEKYRMDQVVFVDDHPYNSPELGELIWYNSHKNIRQFLTTIPNNRKFECRYEDLVQSPETIIKNLCAQIDLSFHPDLLRPYQNIDAKLVDGIYKDSRSMSDTNLHQHKTINAKKAEDWKAVKDNNFLAESTWRLAGILGYELPVDLKNSNPRPNLYLSSSPNPSSKFKLNSKPPLHFRRGFEPIIDPLDPTLASSQMKGENDKIPTLNLKRNASKEIESRLNNRPNFLFSSERAQLTKTIEKADSETSTTDSNAPQIAIVGMACRLPGANTVEELWQNLLDGVDVSKEISAADLEQIGLDPNLLKDPNYVARNYSLADADCFDAAFFGYHKKEAERMDPQHRVLLEVAYASLENAGYNPYEYAGKIGIFGGVARNAYFTNNIATHPDLLASAGEYIDFLGSEKSFSITKIAYKLNLKGPAVNVQTACSSSGTAIHLACQSLQNGDSDMVLVGGGRIQAPVTAGYAYQEGGPLSPDGYIRAFDADAKGMVRGQGMVCIVLKKLDKAIADKDHIWAVIKGTAINNDGANKIGFTAPSVKGQAGAIEKALANAGLNAEDIAYVEAHGTGTILGDPIEVEALSQAFRKSTKQKQFCGIGSIKTAIGHLDAGSCIAGIIKTALALKKETLPPSLHFQQPNPQINFEDSPFYVNANLKEWKRGERVRRAGVSSFGLGGTNVHIILEESPYVNENLNQHKTTSRSIDFDSFASLDAEQMTSSIDLTKDKDTKVDQMPAYILPLSAKTKEALEAQVQQLASYLKKDTTDLKNIAYTLSVGRATFQHRKTLLVGRDFPVTGKRIGENKGTLMTAAKTVWMFPGGGAQYVEMARDLYAIYPVFRTVVDNCIAYLLSKEALDIAPLLFANSKNQIPNSKQKEDLAAQLEQPANALAALFTIEYALAKLWQHWGIQAAELIGHSMGEYTAACIAGVFSMEDALSLVTLRGRLFEQLETEGAMLSVALSEAATKKYLIADTSISVINKPDNCVISGTAEAIDEVQQKLRKEGIDCSRIHIKVAAHSAQIDPIIPEFKAYLDTIAFHQPTIPIISNLSGNWVDPAEMATPTYWVQHLRQTVRFESGLATVLAKDNKVILEVGPGQTLSTFAKQHPAKKKNHLILPSIRHPKEVINDATFLLKTIGKLWANGIAINWENYYEPITTKRVPLPTYPFARTAYWIAPKQTTHTTQTALGIHPSSPIKKATPCQEADEAISLVEPTTNLRLNTVNQTTMSQLDRRSILISEIKSILFELSGLEPEEMDIEATFLELGFDSLFLSQAVIQFNNKFDLSISFRSLFETTPTIELLVAYVDENLPKEYFQNTNNKVQIPNANTEITNTKLQIPNYNTQNIQNTFPVLNFTHSENSLQLNQIIQQQMQLMQQQLQLLGGVENIASINSNASVGRISEGVNNNTSNKSTGQTTNSVEETKEVSIKRSKKGVTAKLGNYKKIASQELTVAQKAALADFIERYNAMTPKSKIQAGIHKQYYADPRSVTGFSTLWKEIVYQIAAEKSKGSKIWDIDGNEYIDYVMSYGMALFGHIPDFVEKAVTAQIKKGNSLDILPPKATEIARMICEVSGMDRATLANTGTEAVLGTVRAARTYAGKDRIAVFDTDYHGLVGQFMLRGVHFKNTSKAMPAAPGIPKKVVEDTLVLDYDDPNVLDKLRANIKELAAVIIEPVQAQNPHWQHHDLIRAIRAITAENDVALIFDEIINGFRLAQGGAQAWFGVEADIVAYGKSISGGFPLSALAGKEKYMRAFDGGLWQFGDDSRPEASVTYFASTFIKNPISVAAGHAAMTELIKQGPALQEDLNQKTKIFAERVKEIFLRLRAPYMIQATASMYMIKPIDSNPLTRLFTYFLRMRGINMRERPCFISTAHTAEDFEKTYKALELAIQDMFDAGLIQAYEGEDLNYIYENTKVAITTDLASLATGAGITTGASIATSAAIPATNELQKIPLTDGQEEIWLSHQFSQEAAAAYNIVTELQLKGTLDKEKLITAIEQLTQRHESLRTAYAIDGKSQTIHPKVIPYIEQIDWEALTEIEQQVALDQLRKSETKTPFELEEGNLVRFILIELAVNQHLLLINVHHIISDGWSLGILTRELGELYSQLMGTAYNRLPKAKRLSEFVQEKIAHQQSKKYQQDDAFWQQQFADTVPVLELPTDFPRTAIKTYRACQEKLALTPDFYQKLQKAAAKAGTTPYIFIMAAFKSFLMRLAQQEEVVFGMAAAGHNLPGNENMVGHLISLLPIRSKLEEGQTFYEFLKTVRGNVLDGFDHQNYTFGTLLKKLQIKRNANRNTLVSVAFNMDSPLGKMNYGGLEVSTEMIPKQFEIFDAFINLKPIDNRLDFEWTYNADLFRKDTIRLRLIEFQLLLENIIGNVRQVVKDIPMLPATELAQLKIFGDGVEYTYPTHERLTTLFEQQVQRQEVKMAVIAGERSISYVAFNEDANRLAHFLKKEGLQVGDYVALCMNGGIDLLIAIYGILKAGGVYVPIDPRNPKERKQLIAKDANCSILLTQMGINDFQDFEGKHFVLEQIAAKLEQENRHNLNLTIPATTDAYVIYTSGSTGQPKGVAIQHRHAINTLFAINEHLQITEADRVYSVSSMSFDMSIPDYFLSLIKGATLILATEDTKKDGFALRTDLEQFQPTFMQATPTTWKILLLAGWKGDPNLRLVAGGEGFSKELAAQLLSQTKAVWNGYGPTETTIYATYKAITDDFLEQKSCGEFAPIGRPIANVWTLILDNKQAPVPIGVPGELYIGGAGVTSGYINRYELTAEKYVRLDTDFVPFTHWYKTGDLVRYLPNGDIDYLGRIDTQVKIRGFRIELGEIEAALNQYPQIAESVVNVVSDDSDRKDLVAYYIPKQEKLEEVELKQFLKEKLPSYMVPALYMQMESFPQNTSLKIDRKALPTPTRSQLSQSHKYEAPRTAMEKQLAGYWQSLLKVDQVSINDDFFDLGGHSLIAVELLATIYKATGIKLPITSLFQNSSIAKQAALLDNTAQLVQKKWTSLVPIKSQGKKAPIYLVHGGGLHVLFYQSLVKDLDEDQPIYALQAKGLDGESAPLDTIEAMATHYINEILDQNPDGPYHLAGYSLGGLIAFEMAKQLKEMGKDVGIVALFDAVAKDNWTSEGKFEKFLKKTSYNFSILLKKPIDTISYKSTVLKGRYQHLIGKVRVAYQDSETQAVEEGLLPFGKKVYEKSMEAFWKYELPTCDLPVLLFKAKDQMFYLKDPEFNGWKPFALGGVEVFEVEGNHHNLFDGSGSQKIAVILQKYMDQFNAKKEMMTGKA